MKFTKFIIILITLILIFYLIIDMRANYEGYDYMSQYGTQSYSTSTDTIIEIDKSTYDETQTSDVISYTTGIPKCIDANIEMFKDVPKYIHLYDYIDWGRTGNVADFMNHEDYFEIITQPKNGIVELREDYNQIALYTPNTNFIGPDSFEFSYKNISTKDTHESSAKVYINVNLGYSISDEEYRNKIDKCNEHTGYVKEGAPHEHGYTKAELTENGMAANFCESKWAEVNENAEKVYCKLNKMEAGPQTKTYEDNDGDKKKPMRNPKIFCHLGIDNFKSFTKYQKEKEDERRNALDGYWTYKAKLKKDSWGNQKSVLEKDEFIEGKIYKRDDSKRGSALIKKCKNSRNTNNELEANKTNCSSSEIIDETSDITNVTEISQSKVIDEVIDKVITSDKVDISVDITKDDINEVSNIINDSTIMNIEQSNDVFKIDSSVDIDEDIVNIENKMIQSCGATIDEAQAAINIVKDESINTNINNSNVFINTGDNVTITDVRLSAEIDFVGPEVDRTCMVNAMKELDSNLQKNLDVVEGTNKTNLYAKSYQLKEDELNEILSNTTFDPISNSTVDSLNEIEADNIIRKNILLIRSKFVENSYFNKQNDCDKFLNILNKFSKVYTNIRNHANKYCGDRNLINDILNTNEDLDTLTMSETNYILKNYLLKELNLFMPYSSIDVNNSIELIVNEFCYNFLDKCVDI